MRRCTGICSYRKGIKMERRDEGQIVYLTASQAAPTWEVQSSEYVLIWGRWDYNQ